MSICLSIDPGTTHSGIVRYCLTTRRTLYTEAALPNALVAGMLRANLRQDVPDTVVVERIAAMGMAVGREVFTTCEWVGYFAAAAGVSPLELNSLTRNQVKIALCGTAKAKDPNIRQRLLDLHGGNAAADKARKCKPCKGRGFVRVGKPKHTEHCDDCNGTGWTESGPIAGVVSHALSALAVAVAWGMRRDELADAVALAEAVF